MRGDRAEAIAASRFFFSPRSAAGGPERVTLADDFTELLLGNPEPVVVGGLYGWKEKPTFTAKEGQLVRVALAWENCPLPAAIDFPEMPLYVNFDLSVSTPIGTAKTNPSMVDNYEVVAFRAPATGTYTVNVHVSGGDWRECAVYGGRETYLAVAWDVKELDD